MRQREVIKRAQMSDSDMTERQVKGKRVMRKIQGVQRETGEERYEKEGGRERE